MGQGGVGYLWGTASDWRLPEHVSGTTINPRRVSLVLRHCPCGETTPSVWPLGVA